MLPPFYYKGVPDDGLVAYVETIVTSTATRPIPIYLYHFPAQSGLAWHVELVERLLDSFGSRIVGLKDSSGDMAYAREAAAVAPGFRVFPSTEAALMEARSGMFAGCISATANLNADLCARAWHNGDRRRAGDSGRDPQAVRRQATRSGRKGTARAYSPRSGLASGGLSACAFFGG